MRGSKIVASMVCIGAIMVTNLSLAIELDKGLLLRLESDAIYQDAPRLHTQIGSYNVVRSLTDDGEGATSFSLEYQDKVRLPYGFRMIGGALTNSEDDWFIYAGVMRQVQIVEKGYMNISFAPGYYHYGDKNVDLDYPLEFKSGVETGYEFDNKMRMGVSFSHISNASLSSHNPGTEILAINYSIPLM